MHRVNRIEVEVHSGEPALARALPERIGRMHRECIAAVLDRVCSELGGGDAVVRIDRLDVDLGTLAADDLEETFAGRLEPALRAALAEALRRTTGDQRARASLELLETFALTGSLPWWTPHDREVVARHFARATVEANADLVALLGRLAHDPGALDRIARMCREREPIGDPSAARAAPPAPAPDEATARPPSASARVTGDGSRHEPLIDPEVLDERQARTQETVLGDGARSTQPSDGDQARPAHQLGGDEAVAEPPWASTRRAGDSSPRRPLVDPEALDERQPRARDRATDHLAPSSDRPRAVAPRLSPVPAIPAAIRAARRGALARLDEVYVADAGLVILWPFLERLFVRAGVLGDDRQFFDEVAQLQAIALVESLATADPAPLEFHLPLAKLLCGRPLESDFVLERPLAPEQLAEGERLLVAVIDRAPEQAALSIASFRTSFLARPGALGTRDGAWLLQVERRPHDAVLDRFPWGWGWIRLPWMPEPLRVEW